jgi:arylesterase/paraoxonase
MDASVCYLVSQFSSHKTDNCSVDHFNTSARSLTDRIAILDSRGSGPIASRLEFMTLKNFSGNNGDGTINLHGISMHESADGTLSILLNNHRPSIDPETGAEYDAKLMGANSTIELFRSKVGSAEMTHVKTWADETIQTPNKIIFANPAESDEEILWTNDHSGKIGIVSIS